MPNAGVRIPPGVYFSMLLAGYFSKVSARSGALRAAAIPLSLRVPGDRSHRRVPSITRH